MSLISCYEDICTEKIWQLNADNIWNFHFDKVGRWWDNDTEIDIVAIDTAGNDIIFGECKYWNNTIGLDVLDGLEIKANKVEWKKKERRNHFILFSISGFSDELTKLAKIRNDLVLA